MFERINKVLKSSEQGFTLVELLVVIAVLGILVGIAIPQYAGMRDRAEEAATKSELQAIRMAWNYYEIEFGTALPDVQALNRYLGDDVITGEGTYLNYTLTLDGDEINVTGPPADRKTALITKDNVVVPAPVPEP